MKKLFLLISLLLFGCNQIVSSSQYVTSSNSTSSETSNSVETTLSLTSNTSSNENTSSSVSQTESTSQTSSNNILNPDGSKKLPAPENKNNKYSIGNNNQTMSSFTFSSSMPDYFRGIYGNNFVEEYYANGQLKITSDNNAKQGFQTGMFISNKTLEVRLQIGEMHPKQKANYDKTKPILLIYAYNDNSELLQQISIDKDVFTSKKENNYIKFYIKNAKEISYLEVRAIQLPYDNSRSYNFGFKGIDLIAWMYE